MYKIPESESFKTFVGSFKNYVDNYWWQLRCQTNPSTDPLTEDQKTIANPTPDPNKPSQYWTVTVQYPCISMTCNVLPLHFAPSQASSSQISNVDNF